MEPLYLGDTTAQTRKNRALTKERYQELENWIESLLGTGQYPARFNSRQQFADTYARIVSLYEALQALALGQSIAPKTMQWYESAHLQENEFFLKQVPPWDRLPSLEDLLIIWKMEDVSESFENERPLYDPRDKESMSDLRLRRGFNPTKLDLDLIGYAKDDPKKQQAFLESVDPKRIAETRKPARIFSIENILRKKRREKFAKGATDALLTDYITTEELLVAFDEAQVRPATIQELLIYAETRWQPDPEGIPGLTEKQLAERVYEENIFALGSMFSDTTDRNVAYIAHNVTRSLAKSRVYGMNWRSEDYFLVFRK